MRGEKKRETIWKFVTLLHRLTWEFLSPQISKRDLVNFETYTKRMWLLLCGINRMIFFFHFCCWWWDWWTHTHTHLKEYTNEIDAYIIVNLYVWMNRTKLAIDFIKKNCNKVWTYRFESYVYAYVRERVLCPVHLIESDTLSSQWLYHYFQFYSI